MNLKHLLLATASLLLVGNANAIVLTPGDPLIPAGLGAGDTFQLVFVTSTRTNPDILDGTDDATDNTVSADWNAYVNSIADSSTLAGISDIDWSAIVSIQDKTADPADPGVPANINAPALADVYRTDGTKIADQLDFYTSTHLAPIKWNENGLEQNTNGGSGSGRLVWTGSTGTGDIDFRPLGNPASNTGNFSIRTGNADSTNDDWINTSDATRRGPDTNLRVYGLSELITIDDDGGPTPLAGDFNGDGTVDAADYTLYVDNLGQADESAFAPGTGDGMNGVDSADYDLWRTSFGNTAPPLLGGGGGAVPEPSTIALLAGGLGLIALRNRRK